MKILLVDDETSVLQPLMAALRGLDGHEVRPAISAEKALANAESVGGIELLIADVVMEPMNGFQLRDELAARYPGLRAIFITEYDLSEYVEQIAGAPVLAKPVDPETLIATVRSEVEAAAAAVPPEPVVEEPPAPIVVPVAVPVAVPRAVPVAVPRAVPAAVPVPTVKAVPAAPKAVPAAPRVVAATPQAIPATPRVVSASTPAAVPVAKVVSAVPAAPVVAKAVPAAPKVVSAATPAAPRVVASPAAPAAVPSAPKVVAAPTATPRAVAAVPKAVPAAPKAVPVAAPAPIPVAAIEAEGVPVAEEIPSLAEPSAVALSLIGQMIGGYQIVSLIGQGRWGPVFAAVQVSINRPVGLKVLDPDKAADETQKARFIADARAKANIQHPSILSVFEAGSADEWIFYTHEYVDGQSLAEMAANGRKIDQPTALKMLKATAEGLLYFERNHLPHTPLEPGDVFLGADGLSRLTNLATQLADQPVSTAIEMETLGRAIIGVLPPGAAITPPLRALLGRTQRMHNAPLANWEALLNGVKALEPKVVPIEAAKISAQDRAAVEAVGKARAQQKRAFLINLGAMASLVLLAAYAVWYVFIRTNERRLDAQIYIPAGEFIFGPSTPTQLQEFWIDKYEVAVGQYAKFVKFIEENPGEEHSYDHPEQPRGLSHIPQYWTIYYQNALAQSQVHSVDQSLNSPAMVKWWDAYAYAKWKGRDLPTEQEWERAARGKRGQAFTFGEDPDPKKANTNSDYNEHNPGAKAKVDGFNYWGDVDAQSSDKSPEGVIGMQGNVSEWTGTRDASTKFPVIKGGNFKDPLQPLTWRKADVPPNMQDEWLGFRTVSHEAPKK
jgi:formylglycine-generating enzyme required for sulfatase activity/CheY-like chemotaxis protein